MNVEKISSNHVPLGERNSGTFGKSKENGRVEVLGIDSNTTGIDTCGTGRETIYSKNSKGNNDGLTSLMDNLNKEEGISSDEEYHRSVSEVDASSVDYPCFDKRKMKSRTNSTFITKMHRSRNIYENHDKPESVCANMIENEIEFTVEQLLRSILSLPVLTATLVLLLLIFIGLLSMGFIFDLGTQTGSVITLIICVILIHIKLPSKRLYKSKVKNGDNVFYVAPLNCNKAKSTTSSILSQYSMSNPRSHNYAEPGQRDAIAADLYEKRPYVKVNLHGAIDKFALLDSGASVSVISSQLVREIEGRTQSILPRLHTDCIIRGIGNMSIEHSGAVLLSVKIGELTFKLQPFIISECPDSSPLIIGSRMMIRKKLLPKFDGDELYIEFGDESKKPVKVHLFGGNDHRLANVEEIECIMPNEVRIANLQFYDKMDIENNFKGKNIIITKNEKFKDFPIEVDGISTIDEKGTMEVTVRNSGETPISLPALAEIAIGEVIEEENLIPMSPVKLKDEDVSCDPQALSSCLCSLEYVFMLGDLQGFTQMGSRFEYRNLDNMILDETVKPGAHIVDDRKVILIPSKEGRFDDFDENVIDQISSKINRRGMERLEVVLLYEKVSFFNDSTLQLIARLRNRFRVKLRSLEGLKDPCKVCMDDKLSLVINDIFSRTIPDVRIFVCHTNLYPEDWAMMIDESKVSILYLNELKVTYFQTDANTMTFFMHFGEKNLRTPKYVYSGLLLLLNQIKPSFPKTRLQVGMTKTKEDDFSTIREAIQEAIRDSKYINAHLENGWKRPVRKSTKMQIKKVKAPLRISGCNCMLCSSATSYSEETGDNNIEIVFYDKFPSDFSYLHNGKEADTLEIANISETGFEHIDEQSFDCDLMLYNQPLGYVAHSPYPKPAKHNVEDPLSYFNLSDVPDEVLEETKQLILDFADSVISFDKADYMPMNKYVLNLKVKDPTPTYLPAYPLTPGCEEVMRDIIDDMLEKGQISAIDDCIYTSPCFLVLKNSDEKRSKTIDEGNQSHGNTKDLETEKKKRSWRLVSDMRHVNKNVMADGVINSSVRGIQESLDRIGNNNFMSSFDISSFFWSIIVSKASRRYLGLSLPFTPLTYCYNILPMGVAVAPALAQGLLKKSLRRSVLDKAIIHVDDILLTCSTAKEHIIQIRALFEDLKEAGLLIHYSKLRLFQRKIKFLGYELSAGSYRILDDRRCIIRDMPLPKTRAQLQSFIGLINFCSSFIDSYQILMNILYPALKKDVKFKLTQLQKETIQHLQQKVQESENLHLIDKTKELIVICDASSLGTGSVVLQNINGRKVLIQYYSTRWTPQENQKLSSVEKELCSLLKLINGNKRIFFSNYDVVVYTDMQLLVRLFGHVTVCHSPKLSRWLSILSSLAPRFKLRWLSNTTPEITTADYLSRNFHDNINDNNFNYHCHFSQKIHDSIERRKALNNIDVPIPPQWKLNDRNIDMKELMDYAEELTKNPIMRHKFTKKIVGDDNFNKEIDKSLTELEDLSCREMAPKVKRSSTSIFYRLK